MKRILIFWQCFMSLLVADTSLTVQAYDSKGNAQTAGKIVVTTEEGQNTIEIKGEKTELKVKEGSFDLMIDIPGFRAAPVAHLSGRSTPQNLAVEVRRPHESYTKSEIALAKRMQEHFLAAASAPKWSALDTPAFDCELVGVVKDSEQGKLLDNLKITYWTDDGKSGKVPAEDGTFSMPKIGPAKLSIVVRRQGYAPAILTGLTSEIKCQQMGIALDPLGKLSADELKRAEDRAKSIEKPN